MMDDYYFWTIVFLYISGIVNTFSGLVATKQYDGRNYDVMLFFMSLFWPLISIYMVVTVLYDMFSDLRRKNG